MAEAGPSFAVLIESSKCLAGASWCRPSACLRVSPEFLQSALLVGEEQAQQGFPLQENDHAGEQQAEQGDQDRHGDDHAVG